MTTAIRRIVAVGGITCLTLGHVWTVVSPFETFCCYACLVVALGRS